MAPSRGHRDRSPIMTTAIPSPIAELDSPAPRARLRDFRTEVLANLIREKHGQPVRRLLVVGCGSGKEAAVLADVLDCETIGIDVVEEFDPAAAAVVDLR